jgi:hypothetical protein
VKAFADTSETAILDGVPILHVAQPKHHLFAVELGFLQAGILASRQALNLLNVLQDVLVKGRRQHGLQTGLRLYLLVENAKSYVLEIGHGRDFVVEEHLLLNDIDQVASIFRALSEEGRWPVLYLVCHLVCKAWVVKSSHRLK